MVTDTDEERNKQGFLGVLRLREVSSGGQGRETEAGRTWRTVHQEMKC